MFTAKLRFNGMMAQTYEGIARAHEETAKNSVHAKNGSIQVRDRPDSINVRLIKIF